MTFYIRSILIISSNNIIHRMHPMCNPPMCNIVPNVQHFFGQFVFCLVSPMCNTLHKSYFIEVKKLKIHMEYTEIKANKIKNHFLQKSRIDNCLVFVSIGSESVSSVIYLWTRRTLLRTSQTVSRLDDWASKNRWRFSDIFCFLEFQTLE